MDFVFENLSWLIIFSVSFLLVYAVGLNAYFIHKNGFYINANCWFCNENTRVLYTKRNKFECCHCGQYNGFNTDGGYNRIIQAQHKTSMNIPDIIPRHRNGLSRLNASNGLCDSCNRNQELKVQQLAKYEPINERKYDEEIKHFEAQLEKTYKLCKPCSKFVESTVKKQTAWIFGNKVKNTKTSRTPSAQPNKLYNRVNIPKLGLLALAILSFLVFHGLDVNSLVPKPLLPSNVILNNLYGRFYNTSAKIFGLETVKTHFPRYLHFKESSVFYVAMLGFIAELLYSMSLKSRDISNVKRLALWMSMSIISSLYFRSEVALYFTTYLLMGMLYLMYDYGSTCIAPKTSRLKRQIIKAEVEDSDSDVDLDTSYKTANNSFTSVKSRNSNSGFRSSFRPTSPGFRPTSPSSVQNVFQRSLSPCFDRPQSPFANNLLRPQSKVAFGQFMSPLLSPRTRSFSTNLNVERPTRKLLSPSRLNVFNSDGKYSSFSMNFPEHNQRFAVNSLTNIHGNNPFFNFDMGKKNLSRSSSSSSGFVSNSDFVRDLAESLPNSRENSPDRNSVLSEPIF